MFKGSRVFAARATAAVVTVGVLGSVGAGTAWAASPATDDSNVGVVSGEVRFDCVLEPFKSGFRYAGPITVTASQAGEGSPVAMTATLPDLPGIAPVPIVDGTMRATLLTTVGGQAMEFKATSTVNSEPKADVPMPMLSGEMEGEAANAPVELTGFKFAFDEDMGIEITADCNATDGAALGKLTSGAGAGTSADESEEADTESGGAMAVNDSGDKLPVLVLWAAPLVVVVVGLAVWLPRRLRARS